MKRKAILTSLFCLVLAAYAQAYTPEYDNNGQLTLLTADLSGNGDIDEIYWKSRELKSGVGGGGGGRIYVEDYEPPAGSSGGDVFRQEFGARAG